jgi:hypothetical protein
VPGGWQSKNSDRILKMAALPRQLTPDQKREYLKILAANGRNAAHAYLERLSCEGGIFIYKSKSELEAFKRRQETCCPGSDAVWVFIPDNGRG